MYERAIDWIKANSEGHGNAAALMRRAKAAKPSWYKLLQGKGVRSESLFVWLENLGFVLVFPGERQTDAPHEAKNATDLELDKMAAEKMLDLVKRENRELKKDLASARKLIEAKEEIIELLREKTASAKYGHPHTDASGTRLLQEKPIDDSSLHRDE